MTVTNCKNLAVSYQVNGINGCSVFIVESKMVNDTVCALIETIDSFQLPSWGIHAGAEYKNIKENCQSIEEIKESIYREISQEIEKNQDNKLSK